MSTDIRTQNTYAHVGFQDESEFPDEVQCALQAMRKACIMTTKVQDRIKDERGDDITQTKQDASPVTIADYAAQAIILKDLKQFFSNDIFLAEESSSGLQDKDRDKAAYEDMISQVQDLAEAKSRTELFDAIDIGQSYYIYHREEEGTSKPPVRLWCLDPIDGTKGFLRIGQYCVALALIEDGIPTIGILACPNLRSRSIKVDDGNGCIFVACKEKGCYEIGMNKFSYFERLGYRKDRTEFEDPSAARFCVAVEQGFNDPDGFTIAMGKFLHGGLDSNGEILHCARMDSQVKYGIVARGDAEFYVRLPRNHKDNIWDVAAGVLCLEEVGGTVTDTTGKPLDFSCGAKLATIGILGARTQNLHQILLDAYRRVALNEKK